jgi:ribosomal protein S15P/S13E
MRAMGLQVARSGMSMLPPRQTHRLTCPIDNVTRHFKAHRLNEL